MSNVDFMGNRNRRFFQGKKLSIKRLKLMFVSSLFHRLLADEEDHIIFYISLILCICENS
jgi:hypothetical protein